MKSKPTTLSCWASLHIFRGCLSFGFAGFPNVFNLPLCGACRARVGRTVNDSPCCHFHLPPLVDRLPVFALSVPQTILFWSIKMCCYMACSSADVHPRDFISLSGWECSEGQSSSSKPGERSMIRKHQCRRPTNPLAPANGLCPHWNLSGAGHFGT